MASAIAASDPSRPMWAWPTLSSTPTVGWVKDARSAISPGPVIAISTTSRSTGGTSRSTWSGIWVQVLRLPGVRAVGRPASASAHISLAVVLPTDPVTPTTVAPSSAIRREQAARSAAAGSPTLIRSGGVSGPAG